MVVVFSYIIAVILTLALAIILYPIAAIFWLLGMAGKLFVLVFDLLGKLSDNMFKFTTVMIRRLWSDIKNIDRQIAPVTSTEAQWTCSCGTVNTGKFCSECGSAMVLQTNVINSPETDAKQL